MLVTKILKLSYNNKNFFRGIKSMTVTVSMPEDKTEVVNLLMNELGKIAVETHSEEEILALINYLKHEKEEGKLN